MSSPLFPDTHQGFLSFATAPHWSFELFNGSILITKRWRVLHDASNQHGLNFKDSSSLMFLASCSSKNHDAVEAVLLALGLGAST